MSKTRKKHRPVPKDQRDPQQPRVRSDIARAAWEASGAGIHGKTYKQRRVNERAELRKDWL